MLDFAWRFEFRPLTLRIEPEAQLHHSVYLLTDREEVHTKSNRRTWFDELARIVWKDLTLFSDRCGNEPSVLTVLNQIRICVVEDIPSAWRTWSELDRPKPARLIEVGNHRLWIRPLV